MEVTNRSKGLDLVDRELEELWMEIHNIVQDALTRTISKKKKCKEAKRLSVEALQIAEERREAKGKGERESYTQLNAEFQRTAKRDKKAFLKDQWKETEVSNRTGKTRDLFKKTGDIKGTFYARMVKTKARNGKDLRETEEIKKRWWDFPGTPVAKTLCSKSRRTRFDPWCRN